MSFISLETAFDLFLRKIIVTNEFPFDFENIKHELDTRAFLLEINGNEALREVFDLAQQNGVPIPRYDIEKNQVFLSLDDLFKDFDGTYQGKQIDTGNPVGKEIW